MALLEAIFWSDMGPVIILIAIRTLNLELWVRGGARSLRLTMALVKKTRLPHPVLAWQGQ
jgi:hypothetical protein